MIIRLLIILFFIPFCSYGQSDMINLSLKESSKILKDKNYLLKITDKSLGIAKTERTKLNSFWYPQINASGTFMHLSNDIEVRQSLKVLTDPAQEFIKTILPDDKIINGLLEQIGSNTLIFPLMKSNLTSVDANVIWPLFTGGKRIYATKLGKQMVDWAEVNRDETAAAIQSGLIEAYFGVRVAQKVVEVRDETYNTFKIHYENALKFEKNGMINRAELLFAKVTMDEAKRELENAIKQESVAQSALKAMLNIKVPQSINPTSPLFIYKELPSKDYFKTLISNSSYAINKLNIEVLMAKNQKRINQSAYLPIISLIGKQTLYSNNVPKYLVPRTMVGVAFTWNIFDGLSREANIRQAKISQDMLQLGKQKAEADLSVIIDELYSKIDGALDDITALNTSLEMSKELVRIRLKSFQEGMATSTEVIDAKTVLSKIEIAFLLAYYQYDSALASLLSVCGVTDTFWLYCDKGTKENYVFSNK